MIAPMVWEKHGKLDASTKGCVERTLTRSMLLCIRHVDESLLKAMTDSAGGGSSCHERGLERGPVAGQQLFAALAAHDDHHGWSARPSLAAAVNANAWRLGDAWSCTSEQRRGQRIQCTSCWPSTSPGDTASFELFDNECLRLKQVTVIDIQHEVGW